MSATYEDQWTALAASALLGTDRRPAPLPLAGPMALFSTPLDQVAVLSAVRRAGLRPHARAALLIPPPADDRPICRPAAVWRLEEIIEHWPILLDEWLRVALHNSWRLAPECVPSLLRRFRADSRRRAAIIELAGPLADWLIELDLAPVGSGRGPSDPAELPPLPEDLAVLWNLPGHELAAVLGDGLSRGLLANRHRSVLIRLVCEIPAEHLAPVTEALNRSATNASTMGLCLTLADLADIRATMIQELQP